MFALLFVALHFAGSTALSRVHLDNSLDASVEASQLATVKLEAGWHVASFMQRLGLISPASANDAQPVIPAESNDAVEVHGKAGKKQSKPHILFILMDDLGWNDVGFRGSDIPTPTIDRLAKQGVILDNYYVLPSCAPTRAALMTGRNSHLTGVYKPYSANDPVGLPLAETTLPSILRKAGYRTHMVGKWHLGFAKDTFTPTFRGFETFYGFYGWGEDYFTHRSKYPIGNVGLDYNRKESDFALDFRREDQPFCGAGCSIVEKDAIGNYSTHLFADRAQKLIKNHDASEPMFMYLSMQAPHAPRGCPDRYDRLEAVGAKFDDQTAWAGCPASPQGKFPFPFLTESQQCGNRDAVFCRLVVDADKAIEQVLGALEDKDMLKNTIVIFSADNGGAVNAPTKNGDAIGASNWPLRGGKHALYEGGVRATGFIWSGKSAPALSVGNYSGLMHVADWLPTLANLAGQELKGNKLSGRDQWASISAGGSGESPHHCLLVAVQPSTEQDNDYGGEESWALRQGPWKLITGCAVTSTRPYGWSSKDGASCTSPDKYAECSESTKALYNVQTDPSEQYDVAAKEPEVLKEMLEALEEYRTNRVPWDYALIKPPSSQTSNANSWSASSSSDKPSVSGLSKGVAVDGVWAPWLS